MHAKVARCIRQFHWKNLVKIIISQLALGEVLKKKGLKNGSGEGAEINAIFASIFVRFGLPFGVDFGPKTESKTECENESVKVCLRRLDPLQVNSD